MSNPWGEEDPWSRKTPVDTARPPFPSPTLSVIPPISREKLFSCRYWKERCFGVSAETLIDRVVADVTAVGFQWGGFAKPVPCFCLLAKLIQIKPDMETVQALLTLSDSHRENNPQYHQSDMRYLRALAAIYVRIAASNSPLVYELLEPLLSDGRILNVVYSDGSTGKLAIDELIGILLKETALLGFNLPPLVKRVVFEKRALLQEYRSWLPDWQVEEAEKEAEREVEREMAEWREIKKRRIEEGTGEGRDRRTSKGTELCLGVAEMNSLRSRLGLRPLW